MCPQPKAYAFTVMTDDQTRKSHYSQTTSEFKIKCLHYKTTSPILIIQSFNFVACICSALVHCETKIVLKFTLAYIIQMIIITKLWDKLRFKIIRVPYRGGLSLGAGGTGATNF
jgi:hypothetical protein